MADLSNYRHIRYEQPADGVARIVLARPEVRNAQGVRMTYEINDAFTRAVHDDSVNVVILAGDGPDFSSGHDLRETFAEEFPRVGPWGGGRSGGAHGLFADEMEVFLGMCERWRELEKPTIAQVQGRCIAGGLMLAWCCDLIVAAEDARFRELTIDMGVMGVEYFMHPYELGIRQAKEFMFTTEWLSAQRAYELGMVNRIVAPERLESEVLALARAIAAKPAFAVRAAKLALNHSQDLMGRWHAMRHSFALHHLTHADNRLRSGTMIDPRFAAAATSSKPAEKD